MYGVVLEPETGRRAEAVVLRLADDWMRLVPQGSQDAVDLRRTGGAWLDERGKAMELEFLCVIAATSLRHADALPASA